MSQIGDPAVVPLDGEAKRKALKIVGEAFGRCEDEDIDGLVAIGAFLDHIIAHLVSMNDKAITAEFLETLAVRVRDGIYDDAADLAENDEGDNGDRD